jgi:hypothetical protein
MCGDEDEPRVPLEYNGKLLDFVTEVRARNGSQAQVQSTSAWGVETQVKVVGQQSSDMG